MMEGVEYGGEERRKAILLSEDQLEEIAERAANKVLEKFQLEVGKVTIRALLYVGGTLLLALLSWLGLQKIGH